MSVLFGIKLAQLLPNGLGGAFMSTDILHGKARRDMVQKMGYPWWFATALGVFKLSQLAMNWVEGGAYTYIAQLMMCFQLGGAIYTHVIVERAPEKSGGCLVFGVLTTTALVLDGTFDLATSIALMLGCKLAGYGSGYIISALGSSSGSKSVGLIE
jgi:hypothetical protein